MEIYFPFYKISLITLPMDINVIHIIDMDRDTYMMWIHIDMDRDTYMMNIYAYMFLW